MGAILQVILKGKDSVSKIFVVISNLMIRNLQYLPVLHIGSKMVADIHNLNHMT